MLSTRLSEDIDIYHYTTSASQYLLIDYVQRRRKWVDEEGRRPPNMKSGRAKVCFRLLNNYLKNIYNYIILSLNPISYLIFK